MLFQKTSLIFFILTLTLFANEHVKQKLNNNSTITFLETPNKVREAEIAFMNLEDKDSLVDAVKEVSTFLKKFIDELNLNKYIL